MREFDGTIRYEAMHHFTIAILEGEIHGLVFVGADNASLQESLCFGHEQKAHYKRCCTCILSGGRGGDFWREKRQWTMPAVAVVCDRRPGHPSSSH